MFTGIVQGKGRVIAIEDKGDFRTHIIELPKELVGNLETGASVANNGCCLTVTKIEGTHISFDLVKETLRLTNLGELKVGSEGGHVMSGHIVTTAEVAKIITSENNLQIWFRIFDKALMKYILHKGFIGIDGISLTVGDVVNNRFCVHLIPETRDRTTLGRKRLGDKVNIELDPQTQAIVDTVERVMAQQAQQQALLAAQQNENEEQASHN